MYKDRFLCLEGLLWIITLLKMFPYISQDIAAPGSFLKQLPKCQVITKGKKVNRAVPVLRHPWPSENLWDRAELSPRWLQGHRPWQRPPGGTWKGKVVQWFKSWSPMPNSPLLWHATYTPNATHPKLTSGSPSKRRLLLPLKLRVWLIP